MTIGQIVYHVNMGQERLMVRKIGEGIVTCDRIDKTMNRNTKGQLCYPSAICCKENLREIEENNKQLSLF